MSEVAHRHGAFGRSRLGRTPRTHLLLAGYGVLACAVALALYSSKAPAPIMPSRANDVAAAIQVMDHGGPPLLASDVPYRPGLDVSHLRPAGLTDDQGIYLYLPLLAKASGQHDPSTLMKWLYMGCFGLLVLVFPLLFYELFGSVTVAVVAPLLVAWKFAFAQTLDLYWILAWAMLLGIPALVLAYRWWTRGLRRRAAVLLVVVMLGASFATSIRIHGGIPLLIGALGIVLFAGARTSRATLRRFWRLPRWWVRPALAVLVVLAYLSIATFGFDAVRAYRNHVIHEPSFGSTYPTEHPFWHNAYIGLGYLPNRYGISYNDAVSEDYVERAAPGTPFLSKRYESVLQHAYRRLAADDPGFVAHSLWTKARVVVADAVDGYSPALVLVLLGALVGRFRREMRFALLVAVPAALLGALAPVLTIPETKYELAWLGTWGALLVLGLAWLWVTVRDAWAAEWPHDLRALRHRPDGAALESLYDRLAATRAAWMVLGAAALTFVLAVVARPAPAPNAFAVYASQAGALEPATALAAPAVASWRFAGSLPAGWTTGAAAFTEPDGSISPAPALYVRSTMTTTEERRVGPEVSVPCRSRWPPGSAQALAGGFELETQTASGNALATGGYSVIDDPAGQSISIPFTIKEATKVRVVVSAWSPFPNASAWVLSQLELVRS